MLNAGRSLLNRLSFSRSAVAVHLMARRRGAAAADADIDETQLPDTRSKRARASARQDSIPSKKRAVKQEDEKQAPSEELRAKALKIADQLQSYFPGPPIPLDHASTFQLLVAVILSAQSTDMKVNEVTPALFRAAPDAKAMSQMAVSDILNMIRVVGLAPTKASNLSKMSQILMELHDGQVPSTFEELEALPGVGHKTASVVMSQAFNHPAFPVDTHIHRLAQRWGLTSGKNVVQTEADLKSLLPEHLWRDAHLQIIYFGRQYCPAMSHDPQECPICSWAAVHPYNRAGVSPIKAGKSQPSPDRTTSKSKKKNPGHLEKQ